MYDMHNVTYACPKLYVTSFAVSVSVSVSLRLQPIVSGIGCQHGISLTLDLNLPTLKYRRLRGDMIEVFKIMHNIYDSEVSPNRRYYPKSNTRGNKYK